MPCTQVDAEQVDALTERFAVETVPCCILFKGAAEAARVDGYDPAALTLHVAAAAPAAAADAAARIKALLASAPLLLFMKGTKAQPYCGFSGRVVEALRATGHEFDTFDIFSDEEIRWVARFFWWWGAGYRMQGEGKRGLVDLEGKGRRGD